MPCALRCNKHQQFHGESRDDYSRNFRHAELECDERILCRHLARCGGGAGNKRRSGAIADNSLHALHHESVRPLNRQYNNYRALNRLALP